MNLRSRLNRLEKLVSPRPAFADQCTCFPKNEPPGFYDDEMVKIAVAVKCPLHGQRFTTCFYAPPWLLERQLKSEYNRQYHKALRASFPNGLPLKWVNTKMGQPLQ